MGVGSVPALWGPCCSLCLESLGRTEEQRAPWLRSGGDTSRLLPPSELGSQRLALIGLSLSMRRRKEELAFVRLPWRRGQLMRASTL